MPDPEITKLEEEFQEKLGTRVHIERKNLGGQIKIDYFSTEDLRQILDSIQKGQAERKPTETMENYIASQSEEAKEAPKPESVAEKKPDDADLYNISNFSI